MSSLDPDASASSSPLIVLVHGGASSRRSYSEVIPQLEKDGFRCIALDLPGHGLAADQRPFTFEAATETIASAIAGVESSTKILVVGISLGGQVVLSFLQSAAAERVNAAIVSGASINPPDDQTPWEIPHMPSNKAKLDEMMEDAHIAGMENMPDLQARSLAFTFEPAETLSIPPTLVVVGEHDTAMSRRDCGPMTEKLKRLNSQSDCFVIPNAWHNHNIDVHDVFSKVISDWARRILQL